MELEMVALATIHCSIGFLFVLFFVFVFVFVFFLLWLQLSSGQNVEKVDCKLP